MSGTDLARRLPTTAARLVANPQADQRNAWDVLVSAFGPTEARTLVAAQEGGPAALTHLGITGAAVIAYRCPECKYTWTTDDDANEWAYGHDCEA